MSCTSKRTSSVPLCSHTCPGSLYSFSFYIYGVFFLPCESTYDYTLPACGIVPCYQLNSVLGTWDSLVNDTIPIAVETIASVSLIVRVQWQKQRLRRSHRWCKQRRMLLQLLLVSGLNISLNLAIPTTCLAHLSVLLVEYCIQAQFYFFFLGYFLSFCSYLHLYANFRTFEKT